MKSARTKLWILSHLDLYGGCGSTVFHSMSWGVRSKASEAYFWTIVFKKTLGIFGLAIKKPRHVSGQLLYLEKKGTDTTIHLFSKYNKLTEVEPLHRREPPRCTESCQSPHWAPRSLVLCRGLSVPSPCCPLSRCPPPSTCHAVVLEPIPIQWFLKEDRFDTTYKDTGQLRKSGIWGCKPGQF